MLGLRREFSFVCLGDLSVHIFPFISSIRRPCSYFFGMCCRIVFFISTVKVVQKMDPPPQPPSSMDSSTDSPREVYVDKTVIGAHLQAFSAGRSQH